MRQSKRNLQKVQQSMKLLQGKEHLELQLMTKCLVPIEKQEIKTSKVDNQEHQLGSKS